MNDASVTGSSIGEGVISVVIADDDRVFSEALAEVIGSSPRLRLVGAAVDAAGAIALVARHRPDVAILDVRMPGGGAGAAREIQRRSPGTAIIALSAYSDPAAMAGMSAAGARMHLIKGLVSAADVIGAIREVAGPA